MNKFNSGPWKCIKCPEGEWYVLQDTEDPRSSHFIAEVRGGVQHESYNKANARLIAAAPEMYELLKSALSKNYVSYPEIHSLLKRIDQ